MGLFDAFKKVTVATPVAAAVDIFTGGATLLLDDENGDDMPRPLCVRTAQEVIKKSKEAYKELDE
jgi:hypothetical protein